ncbi:MAG: HDOD domain-containing protein [Lachnospira sp.]
MVLAKEDAVSIINRIKSKYDENEVPKWIGHSIIAARCAEIIAQHCSGMKPDKAYSLALLHDIGRDIRPDGLAHIIEGHRYLLEMGASKNAKICLTHSFPYKDGRAFSGKNNLTENEYTYVIEYIKNAEYDDYDRLVQLCDGLAMPYGPVILEQRLVENALRNGVNDFTLKKWKAYLDLKKYFDEKCGNIYDIIKVRID